MRLATSIGALLLLAASAWAQCSTLTWDEDYAHAEPGEEYAFNAYVTNLLVEADSVTVTIINEVPDGWTVFMCVEGFCLLPMITTARIEVVPEYPDTVSVHFVSDDVIGEGTVYLSVVPDGCPEEVHTVVFTLSTEEDAVVAHTPATPALLAAYPNPFNPVTTVSYQVMRPGTAGLTLYALDGRRVREVVSPAYHQTGEHTVHLNGADLPSGVYLLALRTIAGNHYRKITLIK